MKSRRFRMDEGRSAVKILTGTPTEHITSGISRCRCVDNIRRDLKKIGINARNCVDSTKDRYY